MDNKEQNAEKAALIAWTAFLFVLVFLSRIIDRRRRRRFAPSLTKIPTRTIQRPSDQGRTLTSRRRFPPGTALSRSQRPDSVRPKPTRQGREMQCGSSI